MPWANILVSLVQSLASSGRSSSDQSYNTFLHSIASKVMSDKAKETAANNIDRLVNNG